MDELTFKEATPTGSTARALLLVFDRDRQVGYITNSGNYFSTSSVDCLSHSDLLQLSVKCREIFQSYLKNPV